MEHLTEHKCEISGQPGDSNNMIPLRALSRSVMEQIASEGHVCDKNGFVHVDAVNRLMQMGNEEALGDNLSADELEETYENSLTFGERIADKIADFGGSWSFIIIFLSFIAVWIGINVVGIMRMEFDQYPFILLNLILSCVAALQAPVIMMSQNRQESKDRLRAQNDYYINLKAEKEIRALNIKVEELILMHRKKRDQ